MKKIIIISFLFLIYSFAFCQTYRSAFDKADILINGSNGNAFSFNDNAANVLHSSESLVLESYLIMYRATKDLHYLNKFIIQAKRVMDHRDDNIQNAIPGRTTQYIKDDSGNIICQINSYPPQGSKAWSTYNDLNSCIWQQRVLHSGSICYSMAEFAYLVKVEEPELASELVPAEANGTFYSYYTVNTYGDFGELMRIKVNETVQFHNCNWKEYDINEHLVQTGNLHAVTGDYYHSCSSNSKDDINMSCTMGRTLIMMYLIESQSGGNTSYASEYLHKIRFIASNFKNEITENNDGTLSWFNNHSHSVHEDITHAAYCTHFAYLCNKYGITDASNNPEFSVAYMKKFAKTFLEKFYAHPKYNNQVEFHLSIEGNNYDCYNCTAIENDYAKYKANQEYSGYYLPLSKFDPDVYQVVSDFFSDYAVYPNHYTSEEVILLSFANLALCENIFNPLAVNRNTSANSPWSGPWSSVAGGDFDGDGTEEFATASNLLGEIAITSVDADRNFTKVATTNTKLETTWAGIAAANLDASHTGDEIAAISNNDGYIYLYKQNGSSIVAYASYNTGISSGWTGIAAGNFDGNVGNEIILSNSNGRVYIYRYNGGAIVGDNINTGNNFINNNLAGITVGNFDGNPGDEIATINNSTNGNIEITVYSFSNSTLTQLSIFTLAFGDYSQWDGITSGNFDGDGIDEIIAHRNYDGDFYIFKLNESGHIINNDKESFPINQLNGVIGSARFSFDPSKDALISLRNYDGNMFIYNLEGLCQGLNLNNITINDAYTIYNPYTHINNNCPIDYHANNTLTASNFIIESGSNVVFTAGNEIILNSGFETKSDCNFEASISPKLSCNNQFFRMNNSVSKNTVDDVSENIKTINKKDSINASNSTLTGQILDNSTAFQNKQKKLTDTTTENVYVLVSPNPNNGNMQIAYELSKNTQGYFEVYDVNNKKLFSHPLYTGKNTFFITGNTLSKGIYFYQAIVGDTRIKAGKIVVEE